MMKTEVKIKVSNSSQEHKEKFLPENPVTLGSNDPDLLMMIKQAVDNLKVSEECTTEPLGIIITTKTVFQ